MGLFDNGVLLNMLGGQGYAQQQYSPQTVTQSQLQSLKDYAKQTMTEQVPKETMYSPLQGIGYLLDKLQGRGALDLLSNIERPINQGAYGLIPQGPGGNSSIATGSIPNANSPTNAIAQPATQTASQSLKGSIADDTASADNTTADTGNDYIVQAPNGQQSILPASQVEGGLPPGYKIVGRQSPQDTSPQATDPNKLQGRLGDQAASSEAPSAPASPQESAAPSDTKESSPIETGTVPNNEVHSQIFWGDTLPAAPAPDKQTGAALAQLQIANPELYKSIIDERNRRYTPQVTDLGLTKVFTYPDGTQKTISTPQRSELEVGGVKVPSLMYKDKDTGETKNVFQIPSSSGIKGAGDWTDVKNVAAVDRELKALNVSAGKQAGDYADVKSNITMEGNTAQNILGNLQAQKALLDNPDFKSGIAAPVISRVGQAANAVGINPGGIANSAKLLQDFEKLQAGQNLESVKSLRGLGQVRAGELAMINHANGTTSNDPEVLRAINAVNTRVAERQVERMNQAQAYAREHNNVIDSGFDAQWNQWQKDHPLFTDEEIKQNEEILGRASKSSQAKKPTYNPQTKKWE